MLPLLGLNLVDLFDFSQLVLAEMTIRFFLIFYMSAIIQVQVQKVALLIPANDCPIRKYY